MIYILLCIYIVFLGPLILIEGMSNNTMAIAMVMSLGMVLVVSGEGKDD